MQVNSSTISSISSPFYSSSIKKNNSEQESLDSLFTAQVNAATASYGEEDFFSEENSQINAKEFADVLYNEIFQLMQMSASKKASASPDNPEEAENSEELISKNKNGTINAQKEYADRTIEKIKNGMSLTDAMAEAKSEVFEILLSESIAEHNLNGSSDLRSVVENAKDKLGMEISDQEMLGALQNVISELKVQPQDEETNELLDKLIALASELTGIGKNNKNSSLSTDDENLMEILQEMAANMKVGGRSRDSKNNEEDDEVTNVSDIFIDSELSEAELLEEEALEKLREKELVLAEENQKLAQGYSEKMSSSTSNNNSEFSIFGQYNSSSANTNNRELISALNEHYVSSKNPNNQNSDNGYKSVSQFV